MTKVFPKSRVCVIDVYPSIEKGIALAMNFISKHNISINSADGRRVLLGFCIKNIEHSVKNTQSSYPKVMCIGKKTIPKRVSFFVKTYFEDILKQMPIPYCGMLELNSPDLEHAAENSLLKQKPQRVYTNLISKLKIKNQDPQEFLR